MPTPPYEHPLKLAVQTVATIVLWTATALIVTIALRRAAKERSALPIIVVLAVAIGSLIEPLYDMPTTCSGTSQAIGHSSRHLICRNRFG
jgi:hypothetical protein